MNPRNVDQDKQPLLLRYFWDRKKKPPSKIRLSLNCQSLKTFARVNQTAKQEVEL